MSYDPAYYLCFHPKVHASIPLLFLPSVMAEVKTTIDDGEREKNITDSLVSVAGGMGRHLGVFSCTMLMYVSILSDSPS